MTQYDGFPAIVGSWLGDENLPEGPNLQTQCQDDDPLYGDDSILRVSITDLAADSS